MNLIVPQDKKLFPFQRDGVIDAIGKLSKKGGNIYNADECGVGKTPQALTICNTLGWKKVLIVCPAIARGVWVDHINEWSLIARKIVTNVLNSKDAASAHLSNFIIVSYNLTIKQEILSSLKVAVYDAIIFDEAHYLVNYKAKRTRACLKVLWPQAPHHIALSGTPFKKNIVDIYSVASKMAPNVFTDFYQFAAEYSYKENNGFADVYYGVKNPKKLGKLLRSLFLIRRTKEEVLPDLPSKTYSKVLLDRKLAVIDMPDTPEELIKRETEALLSAIENDEDIPVVANLAQLRKLQGIKKIPVMIDFIKEFMNQDIPLVVFAWHKAVLEALELEFAKYKPAVVTGKTSPKNKRLQPKRFQEGKTNLFLGQMVAAGTAITLTRATHVVLCEPDWSPDVVEQAVDRVHRIGTKNAVTVYYLCVKDSIDEVVFDTVVRKVKDFKKVLDR